MALTLIGVVAGLAERLMTRLMAGLLFGVSTTDAITFLSVSVGLTWSRWWLATFRQDATKVDPLVAVTNDLEYVKRSFMWEF